MNSDPMTLRQAPPTPMPLPLKIVTTAHFVFAAYLIDRDVMGYGPFAALPLVAALTVGAAFLIQPGTKARLAATILSICWLFIGYGFLASVPILIVLWVVPSVRAYLHRADAWRATHATFRAAA